MSILIKGMEMPKSCNECLMSIEYACMINGNIIPDYWARLDRPTDCHLVELPPHGRLIDADALGISYCNPAVFNDKNYGIGWNHAIDAITNAPTIIEAEVIP